MEERTIVIKIRIIRLFSVFLTNLQLLSKYTVDTARSNVICAHGIMLIAG
jgi:hypothetical protein